MKKFTSRMRLALGVVCTGAALLFSGVAAVAQNAQTQNAQTQNAQTQNAQTQNAQTQNAQTQNAQTQNAQTQNAVEAGWCVTPQWSQLFAARTVRSFRGVVTAFNSQTRVIKVDIEYRIDLDGKTAKAQTKSVNVVLTPRTTLQKVSAKQIAAVNDRANSTTAIQMQPLQSTEIQVGQTIVFNFKLPLTSATHQRAANAAQSPAQVEADAVFVSESAGQNGA